MWDWPGFFSIFVAYNHVPDFWWSGHVGICFIHFLEFYAIGWFWMSIYALFSMLVNIAMFLSVRGHYTLDMISGIIIGHYIWLLVEKYVYVFDIYVLGLPLEKRIATVDQVKDFDRQRAQEIINQMNNQSMDTS